MGKIHLSSQAGVGTFLIFTSTDSKAMKKIEAIIKPFKLHEVRSALTGLGVNDMTISEVENCARRHGPSRRFQGKEYSAEFCPKIKMEIMVADALSGVVSAAIVEAAQ